MTPKAEAVYNLTMCHPKDFPPILIDFRDDVQTYLFNRPPDIITRDSVGSMAYHAECLLEVFNPRMHDQIHWLKCMHKALEQWTADIEFTNILLGLPPER
jgi:hypothetical protein